MTTPSELGFFFPAEWYPHRATWLSYPHNEESWPGKIETIFEPYNLFIKTVAQGERVCINVPDHATQQRVYTELKAIDTRMENIEFYVHPTNDAWCRDHGPAFLINQTHEQALVDWNYNAWGDKYPPYDLDNTIPQLIAEKLNVQKVFKVDIVMEGGSVDFNGQGTVLTTTSCLLNPNRNPHLNQAEIEKYLRDYYGVQQIIWLGDGIEGDDTDGHIDDITRFVNEDTVVTVVEPNKDDPNHLPLLENLEMLKKVRLLNGKQLNVVELPMPDSVYYDNRRLPASYANFYIANSAVIVPTYRCKQDKIALDILSKCFTDRPVIGIDSVDIVWGLGSFHCLSQQEPVS